ncbi:sialate O-acetylesterase [Microbacter margulisiae]|uniref:Sialate O-acetylesterase n=1 Tax=Microbacter margulisiae TaxID=1350067 RepID=A0A7W5DP68_9PORP|nr:sialate O-acetylesterase [Microbacter margulisiae]MBB3186552.1 sialate O-acetylesterase [Microbacter margulisiae]
MKRFIFILLSVSLPILVVAQPSLKLPSILSNHAVMQANSNVKLWGWAACTIPVKIVCSWSPTDTITAMPCKDCSWKVTVKTPQAGGPYSMEFFSGNEKVIIRDLLMGNVWLCSGQSNMAFSYDWGDLDAGDILQSCKNNFIRFFQIQQGFNDYPSADCKGEWVVCDSTSMKNFSLIGYFFGSELYKYLKQPIGLIGSYWSGSCIQSWIPQYVFKDTVLQRLGDDILPMIWSPVALSVLYNAMINPIVNYKIAGNIWYQGESNTDHPQYYGSLFKALILSWRKSFHNEFPFYFIQIAPWSGYQGINGALLREQQATALSLPKTGMITIGDLVEDTTNIHPKLKRAVAERLSNLVLSEMYNADSLQAYQPHFSFMKIKKNKAILTIASIRKLTFRGQTIHCFQIAGQDKVYYSAEAEIQKDGTIVVSARQVKCPVAVRYCFTNAAMPNLFDINGLPLVPFRTDHW